MIVNATESVDVRGFNIGFNYPDDSQFLFSSGIFTSSDRFGSGNGGDLMINTGRLSVVNGGQVSAYVVKSGNAGNITIRAREIEVADPIIDPTSVGISGLVVAVAPGATGARGGNLDIQADSLRVFNGGQITATTDGAGNAGTINLKVDSVDLSGISADGQFYSSISARSSTNFSAGSINLTSDRLTLSEGAKITTSSTATGNAGSINLNIANQLLANNATITTSTKNGQGGLIQVTANRLQLDNNSLIDSSTSGQGNAGEVKVNASAIALHQSTISSQSSSSGNSGTLTIQATDAVTLQNGSQITSRSTGTGLGGTVDLSARSLFLSQNAQINASTVSSNGGNLVLNLREFLQLRDRSLLNAEAGGTGNGGNITLNTLVILGLGNSDIIANAVQGRGGSIQITTDGIFGLKFRNQLTPDNDITASSQFGINGTVQINLLSLDPTSGLAELPVDIVDPSQQIAQGCAANQGNSFVVTGRGGMPLNPMEQLRSDRPWADTRDLSALRSSAPMAQTSAPTDPTVTPLIQATGWQRNPQTGKVELYAETVASATNTSVATCAGVMP